MRVKVLRGFVISTGRVASIGDILTDIPDHMAKMLIHSGKCEIYHEPLTDKKVGQTKNNKPDGKSTELDGKPTKSEDQSAKLDAKSTNSDGKSTEPATDIDVATKTDGDENSASDDNNSDDSNDDQDETSDDNDSDDDNSPSRPLVTRQRAGRLNA